MGHTVDKLHPCDTCGTPTRKRINRGMTARCAECGLIAMREANRRMSELAQKLRDQRKQSGQPSTKDVVSATLDTMEVMHTSTVDGAQRPSTVD